MASCSVVCGLVIQVITFVTAIISIFTPFWAESKPKSNIDVHLGLWMNCTGEDCEWSANDQVPKWLAVIRIVQCCAAGNALVAMLITMGYLCCDCCKYSLRAMQFTILVLVIGGMETVCVVTAFMFKYKSLDYIGPLADHYHLGWVFFVAAGSGVAFIVGIIFTVCETTYARRRINYEPIRPTNLS